MRRIGDAHAVVLLVLLLEAAQDRDRVLDRRLADEDRLEAAGQRRVLLDVLAVLVERGRADAVQLAARQRRLQQVRGVHRAVRLAGADQRVHLVDEQDDAALGRGDLVEHRLQPLLELAAIFRAGDQRAHVEREQLLVLQALRHVAVDDAQRQALRRSPSCRRRARRSAPDCSWCGATAPGWCGGSPRRGRSPGRACRRGPPRSGRGHISSARHRRSRPWRCRRCGPCAAR